MREIKFRAWDKRTKEMVAVTGLNWMKNAKVVGNIYQNPELLESK